jgi:hypothetical protein
MKNIKLAGLALAVGVVLAPSMARAEFIFDINATSEAGRAVTGYLFLRPSNLTITNDTTLDGTLHQRTSGLNEVSEMTAWKLTELGSDPLYASFSQESYFQVDAYLRADGSSELKVSTTEGTYYHSGYQESASSFTLTCACSSLYTATLTSDTFAHYDALKDGLASTTDTYFYNWPDGTNTSEVIKHSLKFSTTAVPEPASVALLLAGGVVLLGRKRLRRGSMPV